MLWTMFAWTLAVFSLQPERMLDLTPKPENTAQRLAGETDAREQADCRNRGTGRPLPAPELSIAVRRLDRLEYAMGSPITAELRVTNIGTQPVTVPSMLSYQFEGFAAGPYAVQASLGILAVDVDGKEYSLAGTVLRGTPSRAGTSETLNPGESINIRFPGWIAIVDGDAPATGEAQLYARLLFSDNECRDWKGVVSERVRIRLRGK